MRQRIRIVVTLALSFLMMFVSPSMAGEIPGGITLPTSELGDVKVVEIPPVEMNQTDSLLGQKKAEVQVKKKKGNPEMATSCSNDSQCSPGYYCNLGGCDRIGWGRRPDDSDDSSFK